jgi:hypothetical protein
MPGHGVQIAGRFVGEQHRRAGDQRAGDRDALLLAAGHLVGPVVHAVGQSDAVEHLGGAGPALAAADAAIDQRQRDVVPGGGAGEQVERLEDEADGPVAQPGQFGRRQGGDVAPADQQGAAGGPVQAAEQVHEGRLAGARGADDGQVVALGDGQRHPAQRGHADAVQLVGAGDAGGDDGGPAGHGRLCPGLT